MGKFSDTSIYGSLDVNGVLYVADKLEGNTGKFSGNITAPNFIGTASKVSNSFKIQLNSGTSEGTNQFTFNGENTKSINITPGSIGSPTLTGTGASGTWSINISGKSANSDKLGEVPLDRFVYGSTSKGTINEVDSNTIDKSGFYRLKPTASSTNVFPASVHSAVIHIANPSANYGHQLALPYSNNNLYIRRKAEGVWGNFIEILSASNYNNFAPTKTGTGASGTWSIAITGNSASATKLATARTLTIGNTGKTFDGTGNVTWTLDDIGASSASHSHNFLTIDNTSTTGASGSVRSGKLQFLQKSGDTAINPDSGWWSVLRTQHAGYDNGYWQEMAYAFASNSIKFRR
ncbi:MAG: pyocin knob domain-containing protein, partial [Bacteroidales bacterium]